MQSVKSITTSLGHPMFFMLRAHLSVDRLHFKRSVTRQTGLRPPCCMWQSQGAGPRKEGCWLAEVWGSISVSLPEMSLQTLKPVGDMP